MGRKLRSNVDSADRVLGKGAVSPLLPAIRSAKCYKLPSGVQGRALVANAFQSWKSLENGQNFRWRKRTFVAQFLYGGIIALSLSPSIDATESRTSRH